MASFVATGNKTQFVTYANIINRKRKKYSFLSNRIEEHGNRKNILLYILVTDEPLHMYRNKSACFLGNLKVERG